MFHICPSLVDTIAKVSLELYIVAVREGKMGGFRPPMNVLFVVGDDLGLQPPVGLCYQLATGCSSSTSGTPCRMCSLI